MPSLNWASKKPYQPTPSSLEVDSFIYPQGTGYPDITPENRLILGDNLKVMSALLPDYQGRINLIYADPPFYTNRRYPARIGRGEDSRHPEEWQLAEGYPDHWSDIESYLDMLYPRLQLMYDLLASDGTLYLHLDWHANAYARLLLDEIFGSDRLINEIVWVYHGPSPIRSAFNRKHDTILVYTKSDDYTFNVDQVRQPYNPSTVKTFQSSPKAGFGKVPNLKRGKVPEDWWYFPVVARLHNERTGYPTQKPEALLERIILASSNPQDLVADFFCGSGTTPILAARLDRKFIANDRVWRAIYTTHARLVSLPTSPFSFEKVKGRSIPEEELQWDKSPRERAFLKTSSNPPGIQIVSPKDQDWLRQLEYWEVDPHWDGNIFRSAAQAIRPRQEGDIPDRLSLPDSAGENPICARFLDLNGKRTQFIIP